MKKLFILFTLGVFVFAPIQVLAQTIAGVNLAPAIIEEGAEPGTVFSSKIKVTNLENQARDFYILTRDIKTTDELGKPIFAEPGEPTGFEISSWIRVTRTAVRIGAGETKEVLFSAVVPASASPGAHVGLIFVALAPERPKATGIGIGYQVGTIISLRIAGLILEEAQIREFSTDKFIYAKPEVKFSVKVENLGNVVVRPRGPLEITDWLGRKAATLKVNDEAGAILPGGRRVFESVWSGGTFAFGRYQALVGLVYGDDVIKNISSTISFWVLPLNVILPAAGALLGLILVLYVILKLHIRAKVRQIFSATRAETDKNRFGAAKGEVLHSRRAAALSRAALLALVMLAFTLIFLAVLFFLFA